MKDETRRMFRRRPDPVRVIVAKARIDGGVAIEPNAPKQVKVAPGQALELAFPYSLREASPDREAYSLRLSSHIGVMAVPPDEKRWGDRWGWPEALDGFLLQRYHLERGRHELAYTTEASYRVTPWRGNGPGIPQTKRLDGTIEVICK
ncbi:MAG: hypothetical protein WC876_01315 [Candidatus Thermoplasmatota archaeon]|jgi:hypothetical protein